MQMKTNKNGVKLLAAVMVFAMAFAGIAVMTVSDDSSAEKSVQKLADDVKEAPQTIGEITAETSYVVTTDKVITLAESTYKINLYVANGVTVTLTGNVGTGTVVIMAADSTGKNYIAEDSAITINTMDDTDKSLSIKAKYSGSTAVASTLTISGNTGATFTIGDGSDVIVGNAGLTTASEISGFTFGSKLTLKEETAAVYSAPGSNKTFPLSDGDVVIIKDGTYTVSNGDNSIRFNKYEGEATITGTATGATTIDAQKTDDKGTISIIKGAFSGTLSSNVFNGVNDGTNYINQIPNKADDAKTYTIIGTYEAKNINDPVNISITVGSNATLIIPEDNTVAVKEFKTTDGTSVVKVFGTLTSAEAGTGAGEVYVGAFGEATNVTITGNSNVSSGDDKGISGDISGEIRDAILTGKAVIPAGQTLTVNGYFGLNGEKLTIEGTLVINSGAAVYTAVGTETVTLKSSGTIVNNGSFGTVKDVVIADDASTPNTITISGIVGAQFGYSAIYDGMKVISISGDIRTSGYVKAEDGSEAGKITMANNAAIFGDLTVGSGVTLITVAATEAVTDANVIIDGELGVGFILDYGASVDVNGKMLTGAAITVKTGEVDGAGKVSGTTVFTVSVADAAGFVIYSENVKTANGQEVRAYLKGAIEDGTIDYVAADSEVTGEEEKYPTLAVTGTNYIDETGFSVGDNTTFTAEKIVLEGTVTVGPKAKAATITDYIGAMYTVKDSDSKITTYYTTLTTALENIESAQNKKVTAIVDDVTDVITVSAGQTLNITINGDVKKGASITAEKDSKVTINADTESKLIGSIVVYKGVSCVPDFTKIDATIVSDDRTTYAGFVTAVDMATDGDTLTVTDVESDESLIVKENITLVADSLTVKGNLTVPESSTLKVGSLTMVPAATGTTPKINVAGTLDLSAGSITDGVYELKSTGKTILTSVNPTTMSGAYYTTTDGLVLTTVENAVKEATEGEIVVIGKIAEKTDITLSGVDLRISGEEVALGNITLNDAKVIAEGKLTATIISTASTTTTGAADAKVSIVGAVITVQDIETGLQINNVAGKVNVLDGVVSIAGVATIATDSELTVAEGAQALVTGSFNATTGKISVNGELAVKGTFTSTIVPVINGTLTAMAGSTVTLSGAKIAGTVNAAESSSVTIDGSDVSVLDGGRIVGEIALGSSNYIKAFNGADVSAMDLGTTVNSTAFYVNGNLLETIYTTGTVSIPNLLDDVKAIPEYNVTSITWKQEDGTATPANIGDAPALYADVSLQTVDVKVSIGSGLSLWIDGVKQVTAETAKLTIGEHQVQVTVNPGYKGDATISFNGAAVTNGKITVTAEMVGADNVISATGDITLDNGSSSGSSSNDGGMGITDILLIVLVVLAAILVVIVALRMMRS